MAWTTGLHTTPIKAQAQVESSFSISHRIGNGEVNWQIGYFEKCSNLSTFLSLGKAQCEKTWIFFESTNLRKGKLAGLRSRVRDYSRLKALSSLRSIGKKIRESSRNSISRIRFLRHPRLEINKKSLESTAARAFIMRYFRHFIDHDVNISMIIIDPEGNIALEFDEEYLQISFQILTLVPSIFAAMFKIRFQGMSTCIWHQVDELECYWRPGILFCKGPCSSRIHVYSPFCFLESGSSMCPTIQVVKSTHGRRPLFAGTPPLQKHTCSAHKLGQAYTTDGSIERRHYQRFHSQSNRIDWRRATAWLQDNMAPGKY